MFLHVRRGERRVSDQTRNMGRVNSVLGHRRLFPRIGLSSWHTSLFTRRLPLLHNVTLAALQPLPTPTSHIHAVSLVPSTPRPCCHHRYFTITTALAARRKL